MEGHAVEKKKSMLNTILSSFAAIMLVGEKRMFILAQKLG
jgi:hypothetical protein